MAQYSAHGLRFHGAGGAAEDRLTVQIDDDVPGAGGSAPCDLGAGDFTLELWVRGALADNATPGAGGGVESADDSWKDGNVLIDRSIAGGSQAGYGVSLAGGLVRFGTDGGDGPSADFPNTIEGKTPVLDEAWHHLALVRDAATGTKRIFVDGLLDFESSAGASHADLSYPDDGVPGQVTAFGPFLVVGAEKHGIAPGAASFSGFVDELRLWSTARTQVQLLDHYQWPVDVDAPGLVGLYRFEEGSGATAADSSAARSPAGTLVAGVAGNGEWTDFATDPLETAPVSNGILPWGFSQILISKGLKEPVAIEFLPDGRLLIAERDGTIKALVDGLQADDPVIQVPAASAHAERGLLGLASSPNYMFDSWIYVFYTTDEPRNRVARFTLDGPIASLASEVVIWESEPLVEGIHHGGCIRFGLDGRLYISTGDQNDSASAQDLGSLNGKLLRLEADGSIPVDNPMLGVPGAEPAIWSYGLRNPWRFSMDPYTDLPWIGNVGGNGFGAWEELETGVPGGNHGWPYQEGPNCFTGACDSVSLPIYQYRHDDPKYAGIYTRGSIIAGPRYGHTAFPVGYQGNLFVGDYANRWIRRIVLGPGDEYLGDPSFLRFPNADGIVDLAVGPEGALYTLSYGGAFLGVKEEARVCKIVYEGGGSTLPMAMSSATPSSGASAPLTVQFSSAGTYDPVPGPSPLSYSWNFGDGGSSIEENPLHTYEAMGGYLVALVVDDGQSTTAAETIAIEIGNAPVPQMLAPLSGQHYQAGDVVSFSGEGTDIEDGVLGPEAFTWTVQLHHAYHLHPFLELPGVKSGEFTIPDTGHLPEDTSYLVRLLLVDSSGLEASTSVEIFPTETLLTIDTVPSGIPVFLDGEGEATPFVLESTVGFQHEVSAQASYVIGAETWEFDCWSDGGAALHTLPAPQGGISLIATYAPASTSGTCALECGFSSYGLGAALVNTLGLVGTGAPRVGGNVEIIASSLGEAAGAWFLASNGQANFPILGGMGLIDPGQLVQQAFVANSFGRATWTLEIPGTPGLAGVGFYLQAAAIDPTQVMGLSLSGGLSFEICP